MIKIVQLDSYSGLGGGQRVMFDIVQGLNGKFDFIVLAPSGIFLKKYAKLGIKVKELKKSRPWQAIKEVRNFIQKETPDILHVHGTRAAFWARLSLLALSNKPKVIYTLHGFHIARKNFFFRWLLIIFERFFNQLTDALVCVSNADKNLVLKNKTIPEKKIIVIRNGIALEKFQITNEVADSAKKELTLENNFILTTVGRLNPPKDFSTILKALKIIASKIKNVKLLIIGEGALRKSLEEETKNLGLIEYVKFLGTRADIPILMQLSDIIILSTYWEGLPIVPLEAAAAKKPIVASNVDGVRETIIDGKTGFLFKPGSPDDLAEKILKLSQSKELREKMGQKGFQFVLANFNQEKMVNNYSALYQKLVHEPR